MHTFLVFKSGSHFSALGKYAVIILLEFPSSLMTTCMYSFFATRIWIIICILLDNLTIPHRFTNILSFYPPLSEALCCMGCNKNFINLIISSQDFYIYHATSTFSLIIVLKNSLS